MDKDYIAGVDDMCNRHMLDKNKTSHCSVLIDFLIDSKMCIYVMGDLIQNLINGPVLNGMVHQWLIISLYLSTV